MQSAADISDSGAPMISHVDQADSHVTHKMVHRVSVPELILCAIHCKLQKLWIYHALPPLHRQLLPAESRDACLCAEKNQKKAIIPEQERSAEEDESLVRSARQLKAQMNDRKSGERRCGRLLGAGLCRHLSASGWSRGPLQSCQL